METKRVMARAVALVAVLSASTARAEPPERRPEWGVSGPYVLDLGAGFGAGVRADDPPRFEVASRGVLAFEALLGLSLSRRVGLGLGYQRAGFGAEDTGILPNGQVRLGRSLDALWASLRLVPLRSESVEGYLRIGPGLVWQHVALDGVAWDPVTPAVHVPLSCSGSALGFGIRAAVGVEVKVIEGLRMGAEGGVDALRMSDDVIGGCAPGAGTATLVGLRAGFIYGFAL